MALQDSQMQNHNATFQHISKNSLSHFVQKRKQVKTLGHVSGLPSGKLNLLFKYKIIDNIINSIT